MAVLSLSSADVSAAGSDALSSLAPTRAEINLAALRHNLHVLQRQAGAATVLGVVKADAYGHGAVPVARTLYEEGVRHFAVATLPEALALREAGLEGMLLVFAAPLAEHLPYYVRHGLDVTVSSAAVADAAVATARDYGPLRAHLKVDTGMSRLGLRPEDAVPVVRQLERAPGVTLAGLWTHFATADEADDTFGPVQLERFDAFLAEVGDAAAYIHAANSGALFTLPKSYAYDRALVRTGITLYGHSSLPGLVQEAGLREVMSFTARITHLKTVPAGTTVSYGRRWQATRPTRIATVAAGYADGYPRLLTNRAEVGLRGRRYPVAGTVCMDMFMVDLGDAEGPGREVTVGEDVVLFGPGGPSASDVAHWAETIPYEICCGVSARVSRVYLDSTAPTARS